MSERLIRRHGEGVDGADGFKNGSVGLFQVTKMTWLIGFLLFMSFLLIHHPSKYALTTGFNALATWHATC